MDWDTNELRSPTSSFSPARMRRAESTKVGIELARALTRMALSSRRCKDGRIEWSIRTFGTASAIISVKTAKVSLA